MKSLRLRTLSSASVANRPRCRCERLRSQNGHRIGTAELRKGADKVKAADVFVAVVPNVVEGY
jgi:hypothetical protein